ncbi:MAG: hypothetical protein ACP5NW_00265 [Candidatus Woesearchaeota archaeon]
MEFSNRTLAWLVLATIVVSMCGTFIALNELNSITAYATSNATGNAQVSISSQTVLNFYVGSLDFGSGSVNGTAPYQCNLTVNKSVGSVSATISQNGACDGFNSSLPAGTLTLENAGNTVLNVTLNFSGNASTIIGGGGGSIPLPSMAFTIAQNETGSCTTLNTSYLGWTEIQHTAAWPAYLICTGMQYTSTSDSISVGLRISIPSNATEGSKTLWVRAQGTG